MLEPGRALCCQSLTTLCRVSTSVMRWVRGPVSSFMSSWPRVPPVHRRWGAAEDGPVAVDQEPLDGCREGLDETGLHMVVTRGLAIGFVQGRLEVLHGVVLDLSPGPVRDPGHVAAEDRLEAGDVHRAFVIRLPPEGANREHHVVGLCEERLGVGDPHVPEA